MREQIVSLIESDCVFLDVGCGTGDLLFKAEHKISFGLGVDIDPGMIRFANEKKRIFKSDNIEFIQENINSLKKLSEYEIDVASSTLCLHEMKEDEAINTLRSLAVISSRILIADYSEPKSFWSKVSVELDEMISGHYGRFKKYRKNGYIPYLASRAGLIVSQVKETPIDGILIWELNGENYE